MEPFFSKSVGDAISNTGVQCLLLSGADTERREGGTSTEKVAVSSLSLLLYSWVHEDIVPLPLTGCWLLLTFRSRLKSCIDLAD